MEAFLELAEEYEGTGYNFSLRETRTSEVIEDVRDFRSDLGVLYLSTFNESVIGHARCPTQTSPSTCCSPRSPTCSSATSTP
ncbi:MAG: hypothetical protein ACLTDR_16780 [Adlercreutzia equolifaciens]